MKRKKVLLTLALALTALCGYAQKSLHLTYTAPEPSDSIVMLFVDANGRHVVMKEMVNNKFDGDVEISEPSKMFILTRTAEKQWGNRRFLLAMPGEKAVMTNEGKNFYVNGSKFYADCDVLDRGTEKMEKVEDAVAFVKDFIKKNPTSEAPAFMVDNFPYDNAVEIANALSPEVRNGRLKNYIDKLMEEGKKEKEMEEAAAKKQGAGVQAPNFTLADLNGKALSLADFRGQYVLLDFWGSWCIWCVRGFPKMKEYYEKYKGKFEILGIDCGDTEQKWRDAVVKHDLKWKHVYNPKDGKITEEYGITGFPTKILVGPDGKIVKTVVGEDPSFYTFLDETFGK